MENQKLSFSELSDTQRQDLADRYLRQHPTRLNNAIVEFILSKSYEDSEAPFSWEDVTNYDYYGTVEIGGYWEDLTEEERLQKLEVCQDQLDKLEMKKGELEELIDLCEFEAGELSIELEETDNAVTKQSMHYWESEENLNRVKLEKLELKIDNLESDIENLEKMDLDQQPEIFQWFSCDERMIYQLNKRGQCTLDGEFWGRQCCGQSITLDLVIQEIAFEYFCEYGENKIDSSIFER